MAVASSNRSVELATEDINFKDDSMLLPLRANYIVGSHDSMVLPLKANFMVKNQDQGRTLSTNEIHNLSGCRLCPSKAVTEYLEATNLYRETGLF